MKSFVCVSWCVVHVLALCSRAAGCWQRCCAPSLPMTHCHCAAKLQYDPPTYRVGVGTSHIVLPCVARGVARSISQSADYRAAQSSHWSPRPRATATTRHRRRGDIRTAAATRADRDQDQGPSQGRWAQGGRAPRRDGQTKQPHAPCTACAVIFILFFVHTVFVCFV
jgi:hypothetical protein